MMIWLLVLKELWGWYQMQQMMIKVDRSIKWKMLKEIQQTKIVSI